VTIRNDASRLAAPLSDGRHARSVIARQGQVVLDVDLNDAAQAAAGRAETDSLDTFGALAAPYHGGGFGIGAGGAISKGRLWLDGLMVENPDDCALETQPHPADPLPAGPALVAIKALVRLVDPVEDRALADRALGDAVAAGRGLIDWQVFALALPEGEEAACGAGSPDWDKLILPSTGRLSARVDPGAAAANFCAPAAGGGYTRLENLLYRVEIDGGVAVADYPAVDGARFGLDGLRVKFSRRNASVLARIVAVDGRKVTLDPPMLDSAAWFAPGRAVELVSVHDDLNPVPTSVRMFTVAAVTDETATLAGSGALPLPATAALGDTWYLRLWDSLPDFSAFGTVTLADAATSAEIDLGDGVRITLHAATTAGTIYRRGDFWTFTARVDGRIDWPQSALAVPIPSPPHGPAIHYARLAATASPSATPTDCRPIVLPLAEQITLDYAGGDGQSAFLGDSGEAFVPLREPVRVIVLRGGLPVEGVAVTFSVPTGVGESQFAGMPLPAAYLSDASGLIEAPWSLDRDAPDATFVLEAALTDPGHLPTAPLRFDASFATAARTSYVPGCDLLAETTTVQQALDTLCANIHAEPETLTLVQIAFVGAGKVKSVLDIGSLNHVEPNVRKTAEVAAAAAPAPAKISSLEKINLAALQPIDKLAELRDGGAIPDIAKIKEIGDIGVRGLDDAEILKSPYLKRLIDKRGILDNGIDIAPEAMLRGIIFETNGGPLACRFEAFDPIVDIELEIPYPATTDEAKWWQNAADAQLIPFATQRLRLAGEVRQLGERMLLWRPTSQAVALLSTAQRHGFGVTGQAATRQGVELRILARLRLRSQFVWVEREGKPVYLNAEYLGIVTKDNGRALAIDRRDPQRAADLDMFFYLVIEPLKDA